MRIPLLTKSLVVVESSVAMPFYQFVALRSLEVFTHHFSYQLRKPYLRTPAELVARLARVAQQRFDLGWAEVARINSHDFLPGCKRVTTSGHGLHRPNLFDTAAAP